MPALSASVSGAKPVQPDMPSAIFTFCAWACRDSPATQTPATASDTIFKTDRPIICSSQEKIESHTWKARAALLRRPE